MSQAKAEESYQAFEEFIRVRDAEDDWPEWANRAGCVMSPRKVSEALGIGAAALRQNSRIAEARSRKEMELQKQGVFLVPQDKSTDQSSASVTSVSASRDKARIKQLEDKNAELREENATLKRMLKKANMFEEHLLQTGRALPL